MDKKVMPVFKLMRTIRDSGSTRNADRETLYAIALRCRPAENFVAWPSYRQLAQDTCLNEMTLKKAARRLEEAKLIKRVVRPNRSNRFFINVPLLQQQASERLASFKKEDNLADENPFGSPVDDNDDSHDDEGGVE